ncbi:Periostin [Cladorrhinum sp. PSN332]|nr:Periostin [Cladorrhinum sp. PSN332]
MKFCPPSWRSAARILAILSAFLPTAVNAQSLDAILSKQPNLSTFRELVKTNAGIFTNLPKGITVVAPNDDAFKRIGNWDQMRDNSTLVAAILKYHILPKVVSMTSIIKGESAWSSSLLTDPAFSTVTGGQHLILTKQPDGKVVFTSGFATRGTVLAEDVSFDSGLVQVIDAVMRVPENLELTARNGYADDTTAFLGALFATGLMQELINKQTDLTIFAPRNSAFQHLAGSLAGLSAPDLKRILAYHIIRGSVSHAWELQNASSLVTAAAAANGEKSSVAITLHTNFIFVNSAQVMQTDVLLSNGVVHIIDNVLDPDQARARPDVSKVSQTPVFKALGTQTETGTGLPTPFAENIPCTASCSLTTTVTATPSVLPIGSDATGESRPSQVSSNAGVAAARCTGFAGGGTVGVVGIAAAGALMVGF